ncbi:MAG: hypothetical protein P1V20_00655 [Verrucomicrobiales bacterium]|nr:hypothetical protein [Verrucomicrobiales bacterium]
MNYIPEILEIHNAAQTRLDELNEELNDLIAEQEKIAEALNELLGEMETV